MVESLYTEATMCKSLSDAKAGDKVKTEVVLSFLTPAEARDGEGWITLGNGRMLLVALGCDEKGKKYWVLEAEKS